MNISAPKENYIFIELTGEDMKKLNITYADMDYSNVETRRVIWTLLDEAKHSLGRELEVNENLKIEALPSVDGGCLLVFSVNQKPACYKVKSKISHLAYFFEKIDDAFDLSFSLMEKDIKHINSSLYLYGDGYIILVSGRLRHSLVMKMGEFSQPMAKGEADTERIIGYGKCLIEDKAFESLKSN